MNQEAGTYALILRSSGHRTITVGRFGELKIRKGYYIYIGSAFGPGGIRARIKRHYRIAEYPYWHIDYLRPAVEIVEIWYSHDPEKREHQWAGILKGVDGVEVPMKGFGSTDCECISHLFFFKSPITVKDFNTWIEQTISGHHKVEWIYGETLKLGIDKS